METYEIKIDVKGSTFREVWTVARVEDLQFNAEFFYGKDAVVKTVRKMRLSAEAVA